MGWLPACSAGSHFSFESAKLGVVLEGFCNLQDYLTALSVLRRNRRGDWPGVSGIFLNADATANHQQPRITIPGHKLSP